MLNFPFPNYFDKMINEVKYGVLKKRLAKRRAVPALEMQQEIIGESKKNWK